MEEEREEASAGGFLERAGLVVAVSKNGMAGMWTLVLRRKQAMTYRTKQNEIDDNIQSLQKKTTEKS